MIHLHRHSEFSLLDGCGTAVQYARKAKELGQPALALTDHGTLSGALHHYKACQDEGIIPILGMEAYFKPNRHLKDDANKKYYHLVLLAKNLEGWHNLMRLSSEAYQSGFYYKPCVDYELLEQYSDGIICSTACISGYTNFKVLQGDDSGFDNEIYRFKKIFGDDLFMEIMPHDFDDQRSLNNELASLSEIYSVPLIATIDAHYPYKEWADTQDILLMVATGQTFEKRKAKKEAGEDVYKFDCDTLYLMSETEAFLLFDENNPSLRHSVITDAIKNTYVVADRIEPFLIDKKRKMPKVKVDTKKMVLKWCQEGMGRIDKVGDKEYEERLSYELGVIEKNDAIDYFYIVGDICRWATKNGIRLGAGRGSAAGSLVSYLIGITALDPIAHKLLFERFMNPDRKGLPDIDLDFQASRRDEVKAYVARKYGQDHVADICAYQTFKPRACIQKISRVFDIHIDGAIATQEIDPLERAPLEDLRKKIPAVDEYAQKHPEAFMHACRLQGQVHTQSRHAGGVVITDKPIAEYMPIGRGKKGEVQTQWAASAEFNIIDEYGFQKIDFLGLSGLDMQEYACDLIEQRTGERPNLNNLPILKDPYDVDPAVMEAFSKGYVLGVWQFTGSSGFANLIKRIKPTWLGDLCAANAIYRPGPLGGKVDVSYAKRKHGKESVEYFHETARAALEETFGLLIYQESIMQLAKSMGGFTGAEADDFRKAVSKEYRLGLAHVKKFLEDKGYRDKWDAGCEERGINRTVADEVWQLILAFGDYGFNKSHSRSYSVQSYQDQWLKVNYPGEFYASLLTFHPDLALEAAREARIFGATIAPPDINKSHAEYTVDEDQIKIGLRAVKNLGDVGVNAIIFNQPFHSFGDFEQKIKPKQCNKRAKESLIAAGAFDCFGMRDGWTTEEKIEGEVNSLGLSVTQIGLLDKYRAIFNKFITKEDSLDDMQENRGVVAGGEIVKVKKIMTKNRRQMGFITVEFLENKWNCTLFPDVWSDSYDLIEEGNAVMVRGRKDTRPDGSISIIADYVCGIEELAMEMING